MPGAGAGAWSVRRRKLGFALGFRIRWPVSSRRPVSRLSWCSKLLLPVPVLAYWTTCTAWADVMTYSSAVLRAGVRAASMTALLFSSLSVACVRSRIGFTV